MAYSLDYRNCQMCKRQENRVVKSPGFWAWLYGITRASTREGRKVTKWWKQGVRKQKTCHTLWGSCLILYDNDQARDCEGNWLTPGRLFNFRLWDGFYITLHYMFPNMCRPHNTCLLARCSLWASLRFWKIWLPLEAIRTGLFPQVILSLPLQVSESLSS